MKIFGKTLKEYMWPIKYYILGSILIVISQYTIALPLSGEYPFIVNITQLLWALMVVFSIFKLTKKGFDIKNLLFTGVLYCFIIHGLKISIRFFFYGRTFWYLVEKFSYGSFLVMALTIASSFGFCYLKKKNLL